MEHLQEKKRQLQQQFRSYDKNFYEEKDYENYEFNKKLEREIKKIDIALAMKDKETMRPIQALQQMLALPCAVVGSDVCIEFNGGILHVIEENAGEHKYILFMSQDTEFFYREERYQQIIGMILSFYLKKAKNERVASVILSYENLNNAHIDVDLEALHFERHEQDSEALNGKFSFIQQAPRLFSAHLPRGFYFHEVGKN